MKNFIFKLIENVGIDNIAHFSIGGLMATEVMIVITLAFGSYGWVLALYPFIAHVVVLIVSYLKERYMDDKFEWVDIWYAIIGSAIVHLSYIIGLTINEFVR